MKARITNAFHRKASPNEPRMVITQVEFVDDAGKVVHSQEYGHLPEQVDPEYFQRQADVMQADLELTAKWAVEKEAEQKEVAAADAAVGKIHQLMFTDSVAIQEKINV